MNNTLPRGGASRLPVWIGVSASAGVLLVEAVLIPSVNLGLLAGLNFGIACVGLLAMPAGPSALFVTALTAAVFIFGVLSYSFPPMVVMPLFLVGSFRVRHMGWEWSLMALTIGFATGVGALFVMVALRGHEIAPVIPVRHRPGAQSRVARIAAGGKRWNC